MCTVTNFALYIYFVVAYQGQLTACSPEYQMMQQIVAVYEAAKYPTPEAIAKREAAKIVLNNLQLREAIINSDAER